MGENSTGKTSFLAALHFCFNLTDRSKTGYFNAPPFDLGSYDDIVHGGEHQSARKRFSISIEREVDISRDASIILQPNDDSDIRTCKLSVFFRSRFGEVAISSLNFSFDDVRLEYSAGKKGWIRIYHNEIEIDGLDQQGALDFDESSDSRPEDLVNINYRIFDAIYRSYLGRSRPNDKNADVARNVARAFDAFINSAHSLVSSPPVRSVPRRVYTSSDDSGANDQSHTPHELNRLKRADRRRWARLNAGLTSFGKLSGLFTRFDIAKLTRQDAGPFQLKVTVRGRSSNIADVGYGVSQALPIMTDLIESGSDRSAFLFQQPEVHLHPRAQAALGTMFAQYIKANSRSFVISETHSDYLIDRLRIEVRRGNIPPDLIGILYFEPADLNVKIHEIILDKEGNVRGAPPSYRQFFIAEQEDVLGL